jgi:hypothetical protein
MTPPAPLGGAERDDPHAAGQLLPLAYGELRRQVRESGFERSAARVVNHSFTCRGLSMKYARSMMLVCLSLLAADALRAGPEPGVAEHLVQQLGSEDFAQREAAAKALMKLGPAARPALEKAKQSDDAEVRKRARDILGRMPLADPAELVRRLGGKFSVDKHDPKRRLIDVDLYNTPATDDDLAGLRGCEKLRILNLEGTRVTVAGLRHLRHLRDLQGVVLPDQCMTDEGLRCLKGLPELRGLGLGGPGITDRGLEYCKEMRKLDGLNLFNTQVTSEGLRHLATMPQLTYLSLMGNKQVTDEGLAHLRGLRKLSGLNLRASGISDAGLVHLKDMRNLLNLSLSGTGITDAGLVCLKNLRNLKKLDLNNTGISDAGLVHLRGLTGLLYLSTAGTKVTAKGRAELRQYLPALRD